MLWMLRMVEAGLGKIHNLGNVLSEEIPVLKLTQRSRVNTPERPVGQSSLIKVKFKFPLLIENVYSPI